ncbi:MAG: chemotaxis protein CheC [Mariprofundaceae bacterium]|nr:chemotaxis protein CheC [Mariprofundaceae bacterium]
MIQLNSEQEDVLSELMNMGVGRASATLNEMIGHHIRLHVPKVQLIRKEDLKQYVTYNEYESLSSVQMGFQGHFDGNAVLVFPQEAASILVSSLTDEPQGSPDMNELKSGTLTEIANILINGVMGTMANFLDVRLNYSVPDYLECDVKHLSSLGGSNARILLAEASFTIDELKVQGDILLFFHISSFQNLLLCIDRELAV